MAQRVRGQTEFRRRKQTNHFRFIQGEGFRKEGMGEKYIMGGSKQPARRRLKGILVLQRRAVIRARSDKSERR